MENCKFTYIQKWNALKNIDSFASKRLYVYVFENQNIKCIRLVGFDLVWSTASDFIRIVYVHIVCNTTIILNEQFN